MIIDFHVHTFPEKIAAKALEKLSDNSGTKYYLDGTIDALRTSMQRAGVTKSVLLPVATSKSQYKTINETAYRINEHTEETGILSFGGLHPENENYREILRELKEHGVKGIKLHPVYQEYYMDGIETMRIIDCACEYDLAVVVHAGYDVGLPGLDYATPKHILPVIEKLHPKKLVLAHTGGWNCWDEVEELLAGQDVFFDTSFSLNPIRNKERNAETALHPFREHSVSTSEAAKRASGTNAEKAKKASPSGQTLSFHGIKDSTISIERSKKEQLSMAQFLRIAKKHGKDHLLFGSDSPWSSQEESIRLIKESGLPGDFLDAIFYKNAERLLQ